MRLQITALFSQQSNRSSQGLLLQLTISGKNPGVTQCLRGALGILGRGCISGEGQVILIPTMVESLRSVMHSIYTKIWKNTTYSEYRNIFLYSEYRIYKNKYRKQYEYRKTKNIFRRKVVYQNSLSELAMLQILDLSMVTQLPS